MECFQAKNNGLTVDTKRDINYSTSYDDRELIPGGEKAKLDWLSVKLEREIIAACDDVLKLERLADRDHEEGLAAKHEENIAYYMRYVRAYERIRHLVEGYYHSLPKINFT